MKVPMFPEVAVMPSPYVVGHWRIETCTLRPPVVNGRGQRFALVVDYEPTQEQAEERMMEAYLTAHPNGCP